MEAQKLITMSINKIAGSRRQRGGINLRKNLLVASVLHSARIHYYEEMCNRMPGSIALEQSQSESSMDDDCTESPDWENDEETVESEDDVCGEEEEYEECADENNETAGNTACEREASRVVVEPVLPVSCEHVADADKENVDPSAVGHSMHENTADKSGHDSYGYCTNTTTTSTNSNNSADCERVTLGDVSQQSLNSNSAVETCTTTTCLVIPSVKRKRTETEEACDSIVAPSSCKRVKVDSQCQTLSSDCGAQSSISTLVDIFKAGFHGLAGESGGKLTVASNYEESDSTSSSSTPSYTTLSTHSRPFETLQTAVIAAC